MLAILRKIFYLQNLILPKVILTEFPCIFKIFKFDLTRGKTCSLSLADPETDQLLASFSLHSTQRAPPP